MMVSLALEKDECTSIKESFDENRVKTEIMSWENKIMYNELFKKRFKSMNEKTSEGDVGCFDPRMEAGSSTVPVETLRDIHTDADGSSTNSITQNKVIDSIS